MTYTIQFMGGPKDGETEEWDRVPTAISAPVRTPHFAYAGVIEAPLMPLTVEYRPAFRGRWHGPRGVYTAYVFAYEPNALYEARLRSDAQARERRNRNRMRRLDCITVQEMCAMVHAINEARLRTEPNRISADSHSQTFGNADIDAELAEWDAILHPKKSQ